MSKAKTHTEIAEEGYVGLTDPELHMMAKDLGVKVHPKASGALVKQRLNEFLGVGVDQSDKVEKAPETAKSNVTKIGKAKRLDPMPPMNSDSRWGGRMRRVSISRVENDPPSVNTYTVTWDGMPVVIKFDEVTDIPAPHYFRLRDNTQRHEQAIEKTREDGEKYIDYKITNPRVRNFDDMGWTPGTEHLPLGKKDFLQQQARKHNNFAGFRRQDLMRIHGILRNTSTVMLRDVSDADIRMEVLEALGPEFTDREDEEEAA